MEKVGPIGILKDPLFHHSKLPLIEMLNVLKEKKNGDFYAMKKNKNVKILVIKHVVQLHVLLILQNVVEF